MTMRRRLCALSLVAAALFLTLATRCHFLSLSPPLYWPREQVEVEPATSDPGPRLSAEKAPPPADEATPSSSQGTRRPCGCTSCVSDVAASDWFRQRFDPEQQPILTQNHSLDPEALKWWLSLQRSGNGRPLQEVTSELFSVIAPPPAFEKPRPSLCRTCAVVGNSGKLLQSGHGKLIDSHHSVIRMNRAVMTGFEQDVGNRSTHHILYPESSVNLRPDEHLVMLPFKIRDLEWTSSRVRVRISERERVLVVSPQFMKYIHENWNQKHGRYPSTGMAAVVLALHLCDQVSLFGFGADSEGNWHHYWEKNKYAGAFRKTGVHNADFEAEILQALDREGKVHMHH